MPLAALSAAAHTRRAPALRDRGRRFRFLVCQVRTRFEKQQKSSCRSYIRTVRKSKIIINQRLEVKSAASQNNEFVSEDQRIEARLRDGKTTSREAWL
jgi:hypothetical protein